MKKDYTELIGSIKTLIEAFDNAREEIRCRIGKIETEALAVINVIDSDFAEDVESGHNPDIQGLYDKLRDMFYELCDEDPENEEFCASIKTSVDIAFCNWRDSFAASLEDFKKETESSACVESDNPFYEVTEIIENVNG